MAALLLFWHSLSPLGLGFGLGGVLVGVGVLLALNVLPSFLVRPLVGLAVVLLLVGAVYQTAYARATNAEHVRQVEAAAARDRAERIAAEAISHKDRERAERAASELARMSARLEKLNDDMAKDPNRDHVCVDGPTARRLRDL